MTGFIFGYGTDYFECTDCRQEIDLAQYQRKIPRCDECEGNALIESLGNWNTIPETWK